MLENALAGIEIANAGVDYLSFTFEPADNRIDRFEHRFMRLMMDAKQQGEEAKIISPQGYTGYSTRHVFCGKRKDGAMFRLSGEVAHTMSIELKGNHEKIKATRIDFQTTTNSATALRGFAGEMRSCLKGEAEQKRRGQDTKTQLIEAPGGGDSIGVGSRSSQRYFRAYNKTAEQKGMIEGNQIRYEIELKRQQAQQAWGMVLSAANVSYLAMSLVAGDMLRRGLPIPWPQDTEPLGLPSTVYETDDERRMRWIVNTVAPVASKIESQALRNRIKAAFKDL